MNICEIKAGREYTVRGLRGGGDERQRLLDLGFTPGTRFTVFNIAPGGGTALLGLRGYMLALRQRACSLIVI